MKTHKAYQKTVGGVLPHQPSLPTREGHNISSLSNSPARGKEGVVSGVCNLERTTRSVSVACPGGHVRLDNRQ